MEPTLIWVLIAVVLIGAVVWITMSRLRSQRLRQRFGSEYDRTIRSEGNHTKSRGSAGGTCQARRQSLHIRPLSSG